MYTQTAQLNFKISQVTDFHSMSPTQFSMRTFQLFPYEGFQSSLITTFKHALFGRWVVFLSRKFFPLEWSLPLWRGSMEWWGMKWTALSSPASQGGTLPGWNCRALQPLCLARAFLYPPGRPPRLCWSVEWDPFHFHSKRTFSWLSIREHTLLAFTHMCFLSPRLLQRLHMMSELAGPGYHCHFYRSWKTPPRGLKCAHLHEQIFGAQM